MTFACYTAPSRMRMIASTRDTAEIGRMAARNRIGRADAEKVELMCVGVYGYLQTDRSGGESGGNGVI